MKALRTYLLPEFTAMPELAGYVHSVFTHAVNVVVGDVMVTLVIDREAGIPDSIVLRPEDFSTLHLRYGEPVRLEARRLVFPAKNLAIDLSCVNHENTFPAGLRLASPKERKRRLVMVEQQFLDEHRLPEPVEKRFHKLILVINTSDSGKTEKLLLELIGLGQGLTPSADDGLLGLLAVRAFWTAAGVSVPLPELPAMIYRLSASRTTDVSRKYLRCAAQGRFSLPLIRVISSLFFINTKLDYSAFFALLNTGHSSGRDIFRGILIAADKKSLL
ncbi:MAG: DUF2877 domain-containing protein [Victivallales bacterium]|nr:DUF2877 domain-containing protein [Victivallales bacterium]